MPDENKIDDSSNEEMLSINNENVEEDTKVTHSEDVSEDLEKEAPEEIEGRMNVQSPKETVKLESEIDVDADAPKAASQTPTPPTLPQIYPQAPLSPSDERTWAMLSHLSILLNLATGFLGPLAALGIYLVYKDRSRYVAYQSMQSFIFQLIGWMGGGALAALLWLISGSLVIVIIGCCLMPIALIFTLVPLAALVYGVFAAIQTNQGLDFKYWLIGDWVRGIYTDN